MASLSLYHESLRPCRPNPNFVAPRLVLLGCVVTRGIRARQDLLNPIMMKCTTALHEVDCARVLGSGLRPQDLRIMRFVGCVGAILCVLDNC